MAEINYMPVEEFRRLGFLQEVNRQFLHPLGLALSVEVDDDGTERFAGIWDARDDPEGWLFENPPPDPEKAATVEVEAERHRQHRIDTLGWVIQPVA